MSHEIREARLIGQLPPSNKPWDILECNGVVFLINPDYPPLFIVRDELIELTHQAQNG